MPKREENAPRLYYAPKRKDPNFKKYWFMLLPKVQERENFHESHLLNLEILCDLYCDYVTLQEIIREEGFIYETEDGRYGPQQKVNAYCTRRDKTLEDIAKYTRLLGITLRKDTSVNKTKEESEEW